MRATPTSLRYFTFNKTREAVPFQYNPAKRIFPLLHSHNLLARPRNQLKDFNGRKPFDDDHPLPVVGSTLNERTDDHDFNEFDLLLNPQLLQRARQLRPTPEYVGQTTGYKNPVAGWLKIGGTWKYSRAFNDCRKKYAMASWQERNMTPRFMLAPRVCPGGPRNRFEGKLRYSTVKLSKILWALDSGRLNPNEVITMFSLRQAGVVAEHEVVWPGFVLTSGTVTKLQYPIHLELQCATARAIKLIEDAGGSFLSCYVSVDGIHQELNPQDYPTFMDQHLPDRRTMELREISPSRRGFLSQWYADEAKYAHPDAGRRQAHYVSPPTSRDFPATVEEYEQVKHHQKWHLNQPGTGTVLPWHVYNTTDLQKRTTGRLS
jgi:ribosomal protein L15